MAFIRNIWYVAAWDHEVIDNGPIGRVVAGEPLALWRKSDGTVMAFEDRCPHRLAPLSMGRVEGDTLRCMYHGLTFSEKGHCIAVPGSSTVPPSVAARSFPVVEKWSWIWVWLGDPTLADESLIPDAWGLEGFGWTMTDGFMDYEAHYELINDNLLDLSHLDYVHENTLRVISGSWWSQDHPMISNIDNGLLVERWFENTEITLPGRETFLADTWSRYRYILPGLFIMRTSNYPAGTAAACEFGRPGSELKPLFERVEQQAVTPVGPSRTRYFFASGPSSDMANPELLNAMIGVVKEAFAEDHRMIEAQQRVWDQTDVDHQKAFLPQDKAPAIFRRLIARRLAAETPHTIETTAIE